MASGEMKLLKWHRARRPSGQRAGDGEGQASCSAGDSRSRACALDVLAKCQTKDVASGALRKAPQAPVRQQKKTRSENTIGERTGQLERTARASRRYAPAVATAPSRRAIQRDPKHKGWVEASRQHEERGCRWCARREDDQRGAGRGNVCQPGRCPSQRSSRTACPGRTA